MKWNKIFGSLSAVLGGLLILQLSLAVYRSNHSHVTAMASWVNLAETMEDAVKMSDEIVMAKVMKVKRGKDLMVEASGEPDGMDRVPTEVVFMKVEKTYMGTEGKKDSVIEMNGAKVVKLFHTGLSTAGEVLPIPEGEEPPPVTDPPVPTNNDDRSVLLEDDPPYEPGQTYALFLATGPDTVGTATMAVISPEGRYMVDDNHVLHPMTSRGMAPHMKDMSMSQFEGEVCAEIDRTLKDNGKEKKAKKAKKGDGCA